MRNTLTHFPATSLRCIRTPSIRQPHRNLLDNLRDEEAGSPNHPELWMQFAEGLGISPTDIQKTVTRPETQALIDHFLSTCRKGSVAAGLVALYAYESQIPAVSRSKIDGLIAHYGITDEQVYRYFTVHEEADIEHSRVERELLTSCVSLENESEVLEVVDLTIDRLYALLDGVCERHGISRAA
ncbi:MAG: iron-containing redox enzyme family protein [bacterium]